MPITPHRRNYLPIPDWDSSAHHYHPIPNHHRRWGRTRRRLIPYSEHPDCHHASQTHHQPPLDSGRRRQLTIVRRRTTPSHSAGGSCSCSRRHWLCPSLHICRCVPRSERETFPYSYVEYESDADEFGGRREGGGHARVRDGMRSLLGSPDVPPSPPLLFRPAHPPMPPPPHLAAPSYQRATTREVARGRVNSGPIYPPEDPDLIDRLCDGVGSLDLVPRGRSDMAGGIVPPPNSSLPPGVSTVLRAPRLEGDLRSRSRRPYSRRQEPRSGSMRDDGGGEAAEGQMVEASFAGLLDTASDVARGDAPPPPTFFDGDGMHNERGRRDRGRRRRRGGSERRGSGMTAVRREEVVLEESSDVEVWITGFSRQRLW